jgi:hypothetical protein
MARKPRLYSPRVPRLPLPKNPNKVKGSFALKTLNNADHRFAIVKELHRRLERLLEDTGATTLQREFMAARAIFLVARCEALEYDAVTGKQINWREYFQATKTLADVLKSLGMSEERKTTKRLSDYLDQHGGNGNGKKKVSSN